MPCLVIAGSTALQDNKVVDHACVALSRIADSFARSPAQLQVLCEHGLIRNAMQLVSATDQRTAITMSASADVQG